MTSIGVIGCGYVFDSYMATWSRHPELELVGVTDLDRERARVVGNAYGLRVYESNEALLADTAVELVVNLTNIGSHYAVTKAALEAGKHVYSEKPLCTDLDEARELVELAAERGLALSCAPSNALSRSAQTLLHAVADGVVGDVRVVYAELDDNPINLLGPETWRSPTGAPWPYRQEYEHGCTYEHVAYHLTVLCRMFGPVQSVTAFSKQTVPDKTREPLDPPDTPDLSIACLNFVSGVVARVTCSIVAPLDHSLRVVGSEGMLIVDTYRDDEGAVRHERFGTMSLQGRKSRSVRSSVLLQRLLGIGGRPLRPASPNGRTRRLTGRLRQRELGRQDKVLGIAELAESLRTRRPYFPSPAFTLHITELTIAIQAAGVSGASHTLETTFEPLSPAPRATPAHDGPRMVDRLAARALERRRRGR